MLGLALAILALSESAGAETSVNGTLQDHTSRVYSIDVTSADDPIEVVVTFKGNDGDDIDLFLDDPGGVQVSSAESGDGYSESLTHIPQAAGVYKLELKTFRTHYPGDQLVYVLNCSHPLLGVASDLTVQVSDGETSWFYMEPRLDGGPVDISLRWTTAELEFDLSVYKNGKVVAEAEFHDGVSDYYGMFADNASLTLNAKGLHLVGLYCTDPSWSNRWISRWDRVNIISNTELLKSQFMLEDPYPQTSVVWYDVQLDAPEKELEVDIRIDGLEQEVDIHLYNPHGTVVKDVSDADPRYSRILHVGITGSYALRISSDRNLSSPETNITVRSSCPIEKIATGMTELAVGEEPRDLVVDVRSYDRPMEVVIVWESNDTVRAELYDQEGYRWFILSADSTRSRSCYLVDVAIGRHTLKVWVDGEPPVGGIMVNVSCSYPISMMRPGDEDSDSPSSGLLGPLFGNLTALVVLLVLSILVLAVVAGAWAYRRRRSPSPIELMWRDGIMEEEEGKAEPVEGPQEDLDEFRNYCAFCGHHHKTSELTKCTVCGRDREEG